MEGVGLSPAGPRRRRYPWPSVSGARPRAVMDSGARCGSGCEEAGRMALTGCGFCEGCWRSHCLARRGAAGCNLGAVLLRPAKSARRAGSRPGGRFARNAVERSDGRAASCGRVAACCVTGGSGVSPARVRSRASASLPCLCHRRGQGRGQQIEPCSNLLLLVRGHPPPLWGVGASHRPLLGRGCLWRGWVPRWRVPSSRPRLSPLRWRSGCASLSSRSAMLVPVPPMAGSSCMGAERHRTTVAACIARAACCRGLG